MGEGSKLPSGGKRAKPVKPWPPSKATNELREFARQDFNLCLTGHAKEQMEQRGLYTGDIKHVLKHGFVYDDAEPATRPGHFKYRMECTSPNSGGRNVRVVVIPGKASLDLKVVTVMWVDEK